MTDLEQLRLQWEEERETYGALCSAVANEIQGVSQSRGIACTVTSRVKETESLIKKAVRKSYASPFEDIHDKAGVRVVCTYRDSLLQLESLIHEIFQVCAYENKALSLDFDQIGYSGTHFEVMVRSDHSILSISPELTGLLCEVQLLTRAQSLWADVSHELAYKPFQESSDETKRLVHLQSALMEIFDNQTAEIRRVMINAPEFQENRMLDALSGHFYRFTAIPFDRELSLLILRELKDMFTNDDLDRFGRLLDSFVECNRSEIQSIFETYACDDRRSFLLFQPESLALFMCMQRDRFKLKEIWGTFMALEYLQELADVWGEDIGAIE